MLQPAIALGRGVAIVKCVYGKTTATLNGTSKTGKVLPFAWE